MKQLQQVKNLDLAAFLAAYVKKQGARERADLDAFNLLFEMRTKEVLDFLKLQGLKGGPDVSQLTDDALIVQAITYWLRDGQKLPELPGNPSPNQRAIVDLLRKGEQPERARNQAACAEILRCGNAELIAAFLVKSFGDMSFPLRVQNLAAAEISVGQADPETKISINDILHDNSIIADDVTQIRIDGVSAVSVWKAMGGMGNPKAALLLSNISFASPLTFACLSDDADTRSRLDQELKTRVHVDLGRFLVPEQVGLNILASQMTYVAGACCQADWNINHLKQMIEQLVQVLQRPLDGARILTESVLLFSVLQNGGPFALNGVKYEASKMAERLPNECERLAKSLMGLMNQSREVLSTCLATLPGSSLCDLLLHCFPLVNAPFVFMGRTLNEGPMFVFDVLEKLTRRVERFPLEFHQMAFELFQKTPWLYIDEIPGFVAAKPKTEMAIRGYVEAVLSCTQVNLTALRSNFVENTLFKRQVDDLITLLTRFSMDTQKLVDIVFSGYFGAIDFAHTDAAEDESSSLEVRDSRRKGIDLSYQPATAEEAEKMISTAFGQGQDSLSLAGINQMMSECISKLDEGKFIQEIRVRFLQFIIFSMKKFRVIMSPTPCVFGRAFQAEAGLSFLFIVRLIKAVFLYSGTDAKQLQDLGNVLQQKRADKAKLEDQINSLTRLQQAQQPATQLTAHSKQLVYQHLAEKDKVLASMQQCRMQITMIQQKLQAGGIDQQQQQVLIQQLQYFQDQINKGNDQIRILESRGAQAWGDGYNNASKIRMLQYQVIQISKDINIFGTQLQVARQFSATFVNLIRIELLSLDIVTNKYYITDVLNQLLQLPAPEHQPQNQGLIAEMNQCIKCLTPPQALLDQFNFNFVLNTISVKNAKEMSAKCAGINPVYVGFHLVTERAIHENEQYFEFMQGILGLNASETADFLLQHIVVPLFNLVYPRFSMYSHQITYSSKQLMSIQQQINTFLHLKQEEVQCEQKLREAEAGGSANAGMIQRLQKELLQRRQQRQAYEPPQEKLTERPLPNTNKSMTAISITQLGQIVAYLVAKRGAMLALNEIDLSALALHSFLSFGGLYFQDIIIFIRELFKGLQSYNYPLLHSGYFDKLLFELTIMISFIEQSQSCPPNCQFFMILACKERAEQIICDYNIIMRMYQRKLSNQLFSQMSIAGLAQYCGQNYIQQQCEPYIITHRNFVQQVLECKRTELGQSARTMQLIKEQLDSQINRYMNAFGCWNRIGLLLYYEGEIFRIMQVVNQKQEQEKQPPISMNDLLQRVLDIIRGEQMQWLNTPLVLAALK